MAPGKTAPRLLQDLLTYDARYEERAGRNLLTTQPPPHDQSKPPTPAVPFRNCRHALINKREQSHVSIGGDDGTTSADKVATFCTQCRWHFDVIVSTSTTQGRPCKVGDDNYPLHHFIFVGGDGNHAQNTLGYQQKPRSFIFRCSAPQCYTNLTINIRPPHISDQEVEILTNKAVLRKRWDSAREFAGERADIAPARSVDALDYLLTYLQDSKNPVKGKTRIPLLNKKFLKTFGRDCDEILKRLGFTKTLEPEDDGSTAEVWNLPRPGESEALQDVICDARHELDTTMRKIPESERSNPPPRNEPSRFPPARDDLEQALACAGYPKQAGRTETRRANHEEDHPHYAGLGTIGDFSDALLLFAYARQASEDFDNQSYYFECLQDLATGRQSLDLQMQVATLASQGLTTKRDVDCAYRFFNIDPTHANVISDEHIIGSYRSRLADTSPSMIEETKTQLRVLGDVRNSERIRAEAADAVETYDQALSWLDGSESTPDDFIPALFTIKINEKPESSETARKAVKIIADTRHSQRLWQFLETGAMTESEMDVGEAYALLNILDRTASIDLEVLQSSLELPDGGNIEKLRKAFAIVQQDQAQNHGNTLQHANLSSKSRKNEHPLEEWPVGLRNIGNTCYLNSVLQFLFTIKPLREMILDCDKHLQDLSPEALARKKVGRSAVTADRVLTAQKFVRELRALFERMISAPTDTVQPDIKIAALALCRTDGPQVTVQPSESADGNSTSKTESGLGSIDGLPIAGPVAPSPDTKTSDLSDAIMDDASDTSMQAMDLGSENNVPSPPSRAPPPIPARPEAQSGITLSKVEESAKQQDAAEVMGNIFDLLSCAIQGEGVMREDEQFDKIKELFFSDVTTVQKTEKEMKNLSELRDHFLVAAGNCDRSLYAAMDDDFGQGEIEGGGVRYDFIAKPAPIQIINVRRLQHRHNKVVLDESHITLDDPLYIDRYMEKTQTLTATQLLQLRETQWEEQRKFREVGAKRQRLQTTDIEGVDLANAVEETGLLVRDLLNDDPDSEQTELKQSSLPTPPPEELVEVLQERANNLKHESQQLEEKSQALEKNIATVFKDHNDHPYRLHTVFTHRGHTRGGHYFVYIYDFQSGQWRSYNDEYVNSATVDDVHGPIVSTGLVYIRADLAEQYTEAVCRRPEVISKANDVNMPDVEEQAGSRELIDVGEFKDVQVLEGIEKERHGMAFGIPLGPELKLKLRWNL